MKTNLILPAVLGLMFQLAPQAAWSHSGWHNGYPYGGISPARARRIWRAEHCSFGYIQPTPVYPYGYSYYHHPGLLTGVARAIF